jgi:hypothetical protein
MSKKAKILMIAMVAFFTVLLAVIAYRYFLEFNNAKVKAYIDEEAAKYGDNPDAARKIISAAVDHVLGSRSLLRQVRTYASVSGMEKEQVLVHTGLMQAASLDYLQVNK